VVLELSKIQLWSEPTSLWRYDVVFLCKLLFILEVIFIYLHQQLSLQVIRANQFIVKPIEIVELLSITAHILVEVTILNDVVVGCRFLGLHQKAV